MRCLYFNHKSEFFPQKNKKCHSSHSPRPHNSSRYKYRRSDPPQHSVCSPLNRTIIMKTVILAVLLLLAVASIVSGDKMEGGIAPGNGKEILTVSGKVPASGKSRYEDETCLPVNLQSLQLYRFVSLLNYELRHDVLRNEVKTPGVLVPALEANVQLA